MENLLISILIGLVISCVIGALIGGLVNKILAGFFFGLFGPIGWIIVLLLPRDAVKEQSTSSVSNTSEKDKTPAIQAPKTRDLSNDSYKLYLAEKYSIKRNDVFEKFVCDDKMFDRLDIALAHANRLETISLEAQEREK